MAIFRDMVMLNMRPLFWLNDEDERMRATPDGPPTHGLASMIFRGRCHTGGLMEYDRG